MVLVVWVEKTELRKAAGVNVAVVDSIKIVLSASSMEFANWCPWEDAIALL